MRVDPHTGEILDEDPSGEHGDDVIDLDDEPADQLVNQPDGTGRDVLGELIAGLVPTTGPDVQVALPRRTTPGLAPQEAAGSWVAVTDASAAAPLVGPDKVTVLTIPRTLVTLAEATVDRGPLVTYIESLLPAQTGRRTGGRTRELGVRALLVGLLLLALAEQAMILRDVVAVLNGLHPTDKHRLGVPATVTERKVSRLFNQIAHALDPSPDSPHNYTARRAAHDRIREAHPGPDNLELRRTLHTAARATHEQTLTANLAALRYVLDRGLDATLPSDPHTGSYAVDGSALPSWSHQFHKQPRRPEMLSDPDARWNGKGAGWFGYWLHGVVRVGEVDGPDTPCLVERIELTAANADSRDAGLELLTRMVADHERADEAAGRPHRARRDILADRAYTSEVDRADDWIWPVFALGFDSVHHLTANQIGQGKRPLLNGAIVVDGQPYSPRLPHHLRDITPPKVAAPRSAVLAYQQQIAHRAPYALHAVGGRRDDGSWDFGCKAMSLLGSLRCDLKPTSMAKPPTGRRLTTDPAVFRPRTLPKICGQQKSRVSMDELPFWQPLPHGSAEWWKSINRRNRVEGIFGNVKNDAAQNLTRGRFRVMGLARTTLMSLFTVMAANLRLMQTFTARQRKAAAAKAAAAAGATPVRSVRRKPRLHTQLRLEMRERIGAAQELAAAGDARAAAPPGSPPAT
ncbi:hypothetical protein SAMN03159343_0529 [Klenkia marina]|uniref:Transposase DDE domain-containing protein n=1 Tax=Klenkia marina TaxID=1960309 RepID=A0A1G4XCL4_9ACTN|nr:hypothetical protein [Klenkia marina]SCX38881.1 hypothetical protein SAMN03159343_0529 [Klenkia marina]